MNNEPDFIFESNANKLSGEFYFELPNGKEILLNGKDFSHEETASDNSKIFICSDVGGYDAKVIYLIDGSQFGDVAFT